MNKIRGILVIIVFFLQGVVFATQGTSTQTDNDQVSKIIAKIEANLSQINTISGRLFQTRSFGDIKTLSKLNFYLKLPDKLYLDYLTPQRQIIVSDGKMLWSYFPSQDKAIKVDLKKMEDLENSMLSPRKILGIDIFEGLKETFDFRVEERKDDQITICATPKSEGRLLGEVKVKLDPIRWVTLSIQIFDKKDRLISRISYDKYQLFNKSIWFPLEIETESLIGREILKENISFHRVKLNPRIPEEKFNFTPPEGIEVLSGGEELLEFSGEKFYKKEVKR
jgi:outer membrane lipoprotein-sorting protein